jgi:hypothetical protein
MREVRIDYGKDWRRDHWRSIVSAYRRSPFFEFYELELQKIYNEKYEYLQDWNRACLAWALSKLGWRGELVFTDAFQEMYDKSEYLDFRSCGGAEGRAEEVAVVYRQVFEERHGFLSNLSILDLLFCEGPGATGLLGGGEA